MPVALLPVSPGRGARTCMPLMLSQTNPLPEPELTPLDPTTWVGAALFIAVALVYTSPRSSATIFPVAPFGIAGVHRKAWSAVAPCENPAIFPEALMHVAAPTF